MITTLVLSGGGLRGIAYCGVMKRIEELKAETDNKLLNIQRLCCVSVGSIFGLAYVLGYSSIEMEQEVLDKKFSELKDIRIVNLLNHFGLDTGNNIVSWIETFLIKKGYSKDITFQELYNTTGYHYQVLGTDINTCDYVCFDYINSPDVKVTDGIRFSISIPFIFTAKTYGDSIVVDGGLKNNYPMFLFEDNLDTVLGVRLCTNIEPSYDVNLEMDGYIRKIMQCLMINRERSGSDKYKSNTIFVYTNGFLNSINYKMSTKAKKRLISSGYDAANEYFTRTILE